MFVLIEKIILAISLMVKQLADLQFILLCAVYAVL